MPGRKPIAREVLKQSGAVKKNPARYPNDPPLANMVEPEMPDYFGPDELQKWQELVGDLRQNGVLSNDNREIMIAYCCAYGVWIRARREIVSLGIEGVSRTMIKQWNEARQQMNKLLPEFGLTPASRQRLVSFKPKEDDPFEAWLAGASVSKN